MGQHDLEKRLFTSESVTCGHPDKLADRISDAVLDAVLSQDPEGRVACETFIPNGKDMFIGGEITTSGKINVEKIARKVIEETGYTNKDYGLDFKTVKIHNLIKKQSPDIALGVNANKEKEQGAGDQGHMFGFAINETEEFMPLAITLSHQLAQKLEEVRKDGTIPYLRPDGKTQVTLEYNDEGKPWRVHSIVVAAQHNEGIDHQQIEEDIKKYVINTIPSLAGNIYNGTSYYINATGKFVIGGPTGDAGLTGRKIIVDTYGGGSLIYRAGHGGGAFGGKDSSKVDRSGAYAARYISKNIVAAGLAYACEVQLAYCIGIAEPISIAINTFGTGKISESELVKKVRKYFPLKPADIINHFGLKNPIYSETACYGHFGNPKFPWEKTDKINALKE